MSDIKNDVPAELRTYTVAEAAQLIGVKKEKLYEYLRAGKLPHLKMGTTRIRHEALVEFLKAQETTEYWSREVRLNACA